MRGGRPVAHGLVIGKFYPPHSGHHYLIETAAKHCRRLSVVVMAGTRESIPLDDRVRWLRAAHAGLPGLRVIGVTDDVPVDYHDSAVWVQHVALIEAALARAAIVDSHRPGALGVPVVPAAAVDLVATSEPYGAELARRLGATHLLVDLSRTTHPVSGTAVRADPVGCWNHLRGAIRAGLARRVVVLGAESTGTTTVSRALVDRLRARGGVWSDTRWVPEYGRVYTEERLAVAQALHIHAGRPGRPTVADLVWTNEDFATVAARQRELEDAAAADGSPVLICDTDAFATSVWHTRYVTAERIGAASASALCWPELPLPLALRGIAEAARADLYLLTDYIGVPFVQDGLRDGEHIRAWMTGEFRARLAETGRPWLLLTGDLRQRVRQALAACDELLAAGWTFADPLG